VLLVEDEDPFGSNLVDKLAELGLTVDRARDGERAFKLLEREEYKAIILDLKLGAPPKPQGLQILEWISSERPGLAVVVVTAYSHLAFRALELGVDALLHKPVDAHHVLQYVQRAIELRQLRLENQRLHKGLRVALSVYAPGVIMALIFMTGLLIWRKVLPEDSIGFAVVAVISIISLIGSRRVSKLIFDFFGQKLRIEADAEPGKQTDEPLPDRDRSLLGPL
jgi:ActR/RegA family two-component response regulator